MLIKRFIKKNIEESLFKGKAIIIYGPRRVGKTTLVKEIEKNYLSSSLYLNCDEPDIRLSLTDKTSTELINFIGNKKLVIIDEAQRIKNIGLTLKLLVDNQPKIQIIATGSSSFELSNKIKESLTGRAFEFFLPPFFSLEIANNETELKRLLEQFLIFGLFPETISASYEEKKQILRLFYKNCLYKDALEYQNLKNPEVVEKLLIALALQIGNEVSFTELANLLGIDQKTVASYIRILELSFVIFRLPPFSRNLRAEISKSRKIYFWDTGIRNAIINNFNPLSLRQDVGALWENFLISERLKRNQLLKKDLNYYFWRTWKKQEVDFIEEEGGFYKVFEFKWQETKKPSFKVWKKNYPNSEINLINKENFYNFLSFKI